MKQEFQSQLQDEQLSYQKVLKATLIALTIQSCYHCKTFMQLPEICPVLKKPLCKACRVILPVDKPGTTTFALLNFQQATEIFDFLEKDFGKDWLNKNREQLKVFDNGHQILVYEFFINQLFHQNRNQRKIQILEILGGLEMSQSEKKQLSKVETERMYSIKIDQQRRHVLKPTLELLFRTEKFQAAYDFIYKGNCDFQALIDFIGVNCTFLKKRKIK